MENNTGVFLNIDFVKQTTTRLDANESSWERKISMLVPNTLMCKNRANARCTVSVVSLFICVWADYATTLLNRTLKYTMFFQTWSSVGQSENCCLHVVAKEIVPQWEKVIGLKSHRSTELCKHNSHTKYPALRIHLFCYSLFKTLWLMQTAQKQTVILESILNQFTVNL